MSQKNYAKKEEHIHKEMLYNIYNQIQGIIKKDKGFNNLSDKTLFQQLVQTTSLTTIINYVIFLFTTNCCHQ